MYTIRVIFLDDYSWYVANYSATTKELNISIDICAYFEQKIIPKLISALYNEFTDIKYIYIERQ